MPDRFHIVTFGCRVNQADTAAIRSDLVRRGLVESDQIGDCAMVVVNSCTVTHRSDQQVRQAVRRLRRANRQARLVITGCYAQRDPQTLARIPGVDAVVGNADKEAFFAQHDWPQDRWEEPLVLISDLNHSTLRATPSLLAGGKTRPHVKIQDGCDARCSYCIIPSVRGPARSVEPDDVIEQIRGLARAGHTEIVLTGVHMGTYGRRLEQPASLAHLVERLVAIPELQRLRLSSIEPMRFSRRLVDLAAAHPNLARHFHLPLQSGSAAVLRAMRRPYRPADFERIVGEIARRVPGVCIGTDVICGFPGETDQEFEETLAFLKRLPLAYIHTFPYSERSGTDSERLPGKVPPGVKKQRCRQVLHLSRIKRAAFNQSFLGCELSAVTLSEPTPDGYREALSDNYIALKVDPQLPANRLIRVRAVRAEGDYLVAL